MNVEVLGQDAARDSNTYRDLPLAVDAASRFAASVCFFELIKLLRCFQLFEHPNEAEKPQQNSKVLNLVMQVDSVVVLVDLVFFKI